MALGVVNAWALPPPLQTYFIPLPSSQTYSMFETINSATDPEIHNVISISINASNALVVYDQHEDGYEADLANPVQSTTQIWGDNNPSNGIPPGFATDVLGAGSVIALAANVAVPHNLTNIVFDAQDKLTVTKAAAVTYSCWPVNPGAVLADAIEVRNTTSWSTNYISPVGTNVAASSQFFEYSGLSIMAGATGTVVRVDRDGNGTFELTNTLNQGEAWLVTNANSGAQVNSSKPVQVALLTGDIGSQYEARWFNLTPVRDWCYCGIVPVTTTSANDPVNVFLYNQYTHSITVDVSLVSSTTSFVVPAKSTYRYAVPAGSGPQMLIRGQSDSNPTQFYLALGIMDASDPSANNSDYDWGFTVPTLRTLSPQVLVGWGAGADTNSPSWNGTQNGSPVWVVARSNTTLYVDYDGNPATGPLTDPNGNKYNFSTNVLAFQSIQIFDPDRDQTGMRVYSLSGTPISAAWGEDPSHSSNNNPYLDMGTTIPSLASFDGSKTYAAVIGDADGRIEPGETIEYSLTLVNSSFNAVRAIKVLDPLPPNVSYVLNSTKLNGAAVPDDGSGTPFPLDAPGYTNIPDLVSFSNMVVTFRVTLPTSFPTNVANITNTATFFTADGDLIVGVDTPVVQADLELQKVVNNETPQVGSNVTFTITVTNRGPDAAADVVVLDLLPAGLSYVSHSGGAYVAGTGLWTIGSLAVGGHTNLQIVAQVTGGNPITNVAQVNVDGVFDPDSTPGNNIPSEDDQDDAVITPVPQIDLELQKSVNNSTPNVGGNVVFTISVTNRGPSDATSVTVKDLLPAGLAYVTNGPGAYAPGTGIWTIGNLAKGASTNLQITATVTNSGNIDNIAQVQTATQFDPDSTPGNSVAAEDDQDHAPLTVPPAIDLELAKTVNNSTPSVGGTIVYTVVLTNKGPNNATGVTVADTLPAGLSYVSHSGPGTYVPGTGVWTIGGPMTPGASRILQITATVMASGTRTNFAQVQTADQYDVDSQPGNAPPYTQDDDDYAAITVAPSADLELTKSVNNPTSNVGGSVIFTVVVTNRGPDNATGVTVEDILPAGLGYASDNGLGAYNSVNGTWTIGALNVGASVSLQITATVTNSGNIDNIAQVQTADQDDVDSAPGNDNPAEDDQDDASLAVPPAIDLELDKSVSDSAPAVGDSIVYTLVLTNKGPNNATGVTVADVLPAGLSYVSHTGPGTYVSGTGIWTLGGPMTPGSGRILAITATVTASGTITNYAQVQTADQYDVDSTPGNAPPFTEDDDGEAVITVDPSADLELTKSVDDSTPNVYDDVIFTVVVTNRGPDNATGVTVEDILPAGLEYVTNGPGAYVSSSGIWTIGSLAVGVSTNLQITATVTNSGAIENIAQVQTADQDDVDSQPANDNPLEDDQDNANLQVPPAGDLELTKTVDNTIPNVGSNIVYTIVVTNRGPDAQQSVSVQDVLPAGLSYVTHAGGLYNSGTGIWSIGNLNANASTSLTITATVNQSGAITNFAQVQTAAHYDVDSTPGNAPPYGGEDDDGSVVITPPPAADLELRKDVDNGNPVLFADVTFTITVTNKGPDAATDVTVEDILPVDLEYVSHTGDAYDTNTSIWTIGGLAVGASTNLQITAKVNDTGVITNIAQVAHANEHDIDSTPNNGVPSEDDQDDAQVSVGEAADLSLTKTVDNAAPNVGDPIAYTVVVTNSGPDNATGVLVEDVLPTGLSYVSHAGGTYVSVTGIWTIGNLAVGGSTSLVINATVDAAGTFTNIAQVNVSDQYDPDSTPDNDNPLEDDQDDAVIRTPQADLELTKIVDNSTPNVGSNVTFTIVVTNKGPDAATSVAVEDVLPSGLLYVSDIGVGAYATNTSIWMIGNLAVGGSTNLQITATVTNSGLIDNIAQVENADQYDPDSTPDNDVPSEDDQDDATLNVPPASDLELTKNVDNETPIAGNNVIYTIVVTNQGPDEGEGISVKDVLPAGVSYVSHANGTYTPGTGIWNIGNLAVGSSTSLTITVKVNVDGVITNVAQIWTAAHYDVDSTPGNSVPTEDDQDDAVITGSALIDLELSKSVDKAEADPFENVVWTIVVTNKGPSTATGVTVYDPLPTNWVYVSDSSGAYNTNDSIWTIDTLPAGGSTQLQITAYATLGVTVMGHGPVPPGYTNIAQVATANEPDVDSTPNNENGEPFEDDEDDAFIPIRALSDLALTKTVDNSTNYLGSQIAYTIVVTNEGPQPAVGVLIEDVLPAGLTYVSNSVGAAYSSGNGIWDIGLILPAGSKTMTIWATVNALGSITNIAQVNHNDHFDSDSTPDNDDPTEDDQAEVVINGLPLVDVELHKSVDKAQADPFENVVWTIDVTNQGPSTATGLTVYDPLPTNWVYVSDSSGAYNTNDSIWTIGTLPAGGSTSLAITAYATLGVEVTGHGPVPPAYTNTAQVWTLIEHDVDSAPSNSVPTEDDQSSADIPIRAFSDLALTKSVDDATPNVGQQIAYTIVVTNEGPQPASGVLIEDVLPAGLTYVSNSVGAAYSSGTGIWDIGLMLSGWSRTLTIWATVDSANVITNIAQVNRNDHYDLDSTPDNDDPTEDDQDEVVIAPQQADLALTKDGPEYVVAGGTATFTIIVTNNGPDAATGVTVEDILPAGLVYVSHAGGTYDSGTGIWTIGNLAVGSSTSLQVVATVTTTGLFTNVAQVNTSDQHDPNSTPGNDNPEEDDQDYADVDSVQPAVHIIKTAADAADGGVKYVAPGSSVVYAYAISNAGDTYLSNVVVTDDVLGVIGTIDGPWAPGASTTLYATSAIAASVTNIGTVVATPATSEGDSLPGILDVTDSDDAIVRTAFLSIEKEDLPDPVHPGGVLSYTLWIANPSANPVLNVVVTEQYPAQFAFVAANPAPDSGNNSWNLGTLEPGDLRSIVIDGTVLANTPGGSILTNRITVTSNVGTNTVEEPTLVVSNPPPGQAEIRVTKRDLMDPVGPGSNLVYAIRVENQGPETATNVVVTETYDDLFTFVGAGPAPSSGNNVWNLGDLLVGTYREITVTGVVSVAATDGTLLTNRVAAVADNAPPSADDEITLVLTNPPPPPEIFKTASTNLLLAGQTLIYTITVQNASALVVPNASVVETYDPLFHYGSSVPAPVAGTDNLWDLGDLAAGSTTQIVITGIVLPNFIASATVFNTAELISDFGSRTVHLTTEVVQPGSIGDFVWLDEDWDGEQDAGEAGIANVRLDLLDSGANVIETTLTGINGFYLFSKLPAGQYTVRVDTNSLAPQLRGHQTFDPDSITNNATTVTLAAGETIWTADFGYNWSPPGFLVGSIGDRVWVDADADGMQESGEPGIPNVTVKLYVDAAGNGSYTTVWATTTTDGAGMYIFTGLAAGTYVVRVATNTLPPNFIQTGDPDYFGTSLPAGQGDHRTTTPVVVAPGDVFVNADFGYWFPTGSKIGDLIYFDADADGIFNAGDYGIEDVTVVLLNGGGTVIASTITDENGAYLFTGLPAGTYTVWVNDAGNVLNDLVPSADPDGGLANRSTTAVNGVTDNLDQDFGYTTDTQEPGFGLIGDAIFIDRNGNNAWDPGEGIQGVTVRLFAGDGTTLLNTTITDPNGHYYFGGLVLDAVYEIHVDTTTLPNGGVGLVNTFDPDTATPGDSLSAVVLEVGNPINLDQDFGYVGLNTIGGTLWKDCNADGILDDDETPRWAGVTIQLNDTNGNRLGTMLTDTNGDYSFGGLSDGTYVVDVVDHANVLNGFWHSLGPNPPGVDNHSQEDPYLVTVSGGETDTTGDFGYYLVVAELGDYVWYDINGNGKQEGGEPGLANVRVTLKIRYPNGTEIALQTLTDSTGHYLFANLLLDERYNESTLGNPTVMGLPRFQISIDGSQSILAGDGYDPTLIGAGDGSNDSREHAGVFALLQRCGRPVTFDFGYKGGPLLAVIGNVDAFTRDGQTIVRWETVESWGTAGFWLERQVGDAWVRISQDLIPFPLFGVAPIVYEEVDPGAVAGGTYLYRLVELENSGNELIYGPYPLTVDGPGRTYGDWAAAHFTAVELANAEISGQNADPDGDGLTNWQEFLAGTDPDSADSVLQITGMRPVAGGLELNWKSVAGKFYRVAVSDSMSSPFLPLEQSILATDENGRAVLSVDFQDRQMYFQVILVGGP